MTSSSRSEACPDDSPSSSTGMEVCIRGPDEWYEPSLMDISDSRSAESQSVISGDKVKSLAITLACAFSCAFVAADVAWPSDVDGFRC